MTSWWFRLVLLSLLAQPALAAIDETTVETIVKNSPCLDNQSIENTLNNKIKTGSQRDLGWQIFKEDNLFAVERAFLINKSMQLRYRWQVNPDGTITPASKRAETLCTQESE